MVSIYEIEGEPLLVSQLVSCVNFLFQENIALNHMQSGQMFCLCCYLGILQSTLTLEMEEHYCIAGIFKELTVQ